MYVLKRGKCGVHVATDVTDSPNKHIGKEVAELNEPDFFGELALRQADSKRTVSRCYCVCAARNSRALPLITVRASSKRMLMPHYHLFPPHSF